MRKSLQRSLLLAVALLALAGLGYYVFWTDSADYRKYKQIQIGMTVEDVEAILGPGEIISQDGVPGIVVPLNPGDAEASEERARRSGRSPPTIRDYPTRIKPRVEGDRILRWVNGKTGERILVAFKDGKVCEKDYLDPNFL